MSLLPRATVRGVHSPPMKTSSKVAVTSLAVLAIAGLAASDALLREKSLTGQLGLWLEGGEESSVSSVATGTGSTSSVAMDPAGNKDQLLQTLVAQGFTFEEKEEPSFLRQILPGSQIPTVTLLKDGDRAGSLAWIVTPESAKAYQTLKESLLQSFSANLQDLKDETQEIPGKPVRSTLTFLDPALSTERLLFVKTGDALIELHITTGKEDAVAPLVDSLSQALAQ